MHDPNTVALVGDKRLVPGKVEGGVPVRAMRLFRIRDGQKFKVTFLINEDRIIEHEAEELVETSNPLDARKAQLIRDGFHFSIQPGGGIHILKVPEREYQLLRVFSPSQPCWFEGCAEIRAEYDAESQKLNTPGCSNCDLGALQRSFRERIIKALTDAGLWPKLKELGKEVKKDAPTRPGN